VSSVAGKTLGLCDPPSILSRLLPLLAVSWRSGILLSRQRRECGQGCRSESIFLLPRSRWDLSYLSLSVTAHRMLKDHSNRGKEGRTCKALPPAIMTLKIFLNDKSFHCLKQAIPPKSLSKVIVEEAVHLNFFGSNTVLICDEAQARNLLLYVTHCPGVITSIHKALLSAGLSLDSPVPDQSTDSPTRHPIPSHGPRRT
jgi:hypothetical protein